MTTPETPHQPALPSPTFFFAGAVIVGLFFAFWSWLVIGEKALDSFDMRCAEFWYGWSPAHDQLGKLMVFLTDLGGVAAMTLMAIMGAIWQTAIKHRFLAIAWLGVVLGGGI